MIQEKINAMEEKVTLVENKVLEMEKDFDKKVQENIKAEVWKIEENFEEALCSVKEEIKGLKKQMSNRPFEANGTVLSSSTTIKPLQHLIWENILANV